MVGKMKYGLEFCISFFIFHLWSSYRIEILLSVFMPDNLPNISHIELSRPDISDPVWGYFILKRPKGPIVVSCERLVFRALMNQCSSNVVVIIDYVICNN